METKKEKMKRKTGCSGYDVSCPGIQSKEGEKRVWKKSGKI
jgi:hypothetical protein